MTGKRSPLVTRTVFGEPWALHEAKLNDVTAMIRAWLTSGKTTPPEGYERRGENDVTPTIYHSEGEATFAFEGLEAWQAFALESSRVSAGGAVAVLPIMGVLAYRSNLMSEMSGGTSTDKLAAQFRELAASPDIGTIVLRVDSGGGQVDGIMELAEEIRAARATKRIVGIADTFAASAAYWLLSQADEVVVTPSGQVGSIGVFVDHIDNSEAMAAAGLKTTRVSAGKFKGETAGPLTDDAIGHIQGQVNSIFQTFLADVARGRGVTSSKVLSNFGEGRMLLAKDALAAGMVDRVESFHKMIGRLVGGSRRRGGNMGSMTNAFAADAVELNDGTPFKIEAEFNDADGDRGLVPFSPEAMAEIELAEAQIEEEVDAIGLTA
jgi:capsid assembly protease